MTFASTYEIQVVNVDYFVLDFVYHLNTRKERREESVVEQLGMSERVKAIVLSCG